MARRQAKPKNCIVIETYAELKTFVESFAKGLLTLLIIIGRGGIQKSRLVRETLGAGVCTIEGNASPFGIYRSLYHHRDQLVFIDDVDCLHSNPAGIRLLKNLCQTESLKRICWTTQAAALDRDKIPREFKTTSKVVLVANTWSTLNQNVAAVEDRGHVLYFDPSPMEIHERTATWFWDQEIYDFIGEHCHLMCNLTMRDYFRSWELKNAGVQDWQVLLLKRTLPNEAAVVAWRLKCDPSFTSDAQRVEEFIRVTGRKRASFYNYLRKFRPTEKAHPVTLSNLAPKGWNANDGILQILRRRHGQLGNG